MKLLKRGLFGLLAAPGIKTALGPVRRGTGTVFLIHRMADPQNGRPGLDPAKLHRALAFLRRRRYELVDVGELFLRLKEPGRAADLGVAFTLDDGYTDQVRVAGPIFAEFDCPATIFLTTGFLDGELWQWWDRIEYVFDHCRRREVSVEVGGTLLRSEPSTAAGRARATTEFVELCKRVPERARQEAIQDLAVAAEVPLPAAPPGRYAPMSWTEVQEWEERGLTFGPHSITHPILSRTSEEQSRREIAGSWDRLRAMTRRPIPVFCYPNGRPGDNGMREWETIRALGLDGALTATPGYAKVEEFHQRPENRFAVRRFILPADHRQLPLYVTGAARMHPGLGGA